MTPFWLGRWINDKPLKLVYPILYELTEKPWGKVAKMGRKIQGVRAWDFHISDGQLFIENEEEIRQRNELT